MKTKSRKRLLVSSVAMLLVAMLALGTATYAWFTSSASIEAKGLNVKTSQVSELQISDYNKGWRSSELNYGIANKTMNPASSANGTSWFKASAASKDAFTANTTGFETVSAPEFHKATSSSFVYKDQLNVRNNGNADVNNVTISWSMPAVENSNYLRVALVPAKSDGTELTQAEINTTYGASTELKAGFAANIYDVDGVEYKAANAVGAVTTTNVTAITPKTECTVSIGTLRGKTTLGGSATSGDAVYFNLYVWFEGQDTECTDTTAGQVIDDIVFTIAGATA